MMTAEMKIARNKDFDYIPASHEDPANPGVLKKVLFKKDDLIKGQIMMINWSKMAPGKSFSAHYHEDMDEVFIMMQGKAEIRIDNEKEIIEAGDAVLTPMKSVHEMWNVGDEDVLYIALGISLEQGGKSINV